jgi:aspartyl/asparaginyl beta-hydroxylase (cupin superfamily)
MAKAGKSKSGHGSQGGLRVSDDHRSPRYRRRKMQRMLEKNPALLEELTKQMILNGSLPEGYFKSPEAED